MHFIISWDINATGSEWEQHNEAMKSFLKPYSWAKPLSTIYIVNVVGQFNWDNILQQITNYVQSFPGKINFIMSPLMSGGRYNGVLSNEMWNEVNMRSN
ncbi:hypothetical protein [Aeromonas caviae]|uniref:hypothetical protein n=1 Tax=Aeromonas caviae TaxID=648 RepID=UPI002B459781|nr:hypothetical protein [Aeromonas caviae]